jgi:hypothetical protein
MYDLLKQFQNALGLDLQFHGGPGTMRPVEPRDVDMSGSHTANTYDASAADESSGGRSLHKSKLL